MRESFKKLVPRAIGTYLNMLSLFSPARTQKKAFDLFSKPRRGKIGEHHKAFLDNAKEARVEHDGLEIQVYHWPGKGPTILLVHGWESNSHRWKMLIEQLIPQGYDIYTFDAPAHGYSTGTNLYVPLYRDVLHTIISRYAPQYIIGHSVGAMTTLYELSQSKDNNIKKAVLLGPPDDLDSILGEYRSILGLRQRVMQQLDAYFQKRFGFKSSSFASSLFARNIKTPGLIIHDKDDRITPLSGSKNIHKNWRGSQLIITEGLNHSLYDRDVNKKIIDFISA